MCSEREGSALKDRLRTTPGPNLGLPAAGLALDAGAADAIRKAAVDLGGVASSNYETGDRVRAAHPADLALTHQLIESSHGLSVFLDAGGDAA